MLFLYTVPVLALPCSLPEFRDYVKKVVNLNWNLEMAFISLFVIFQHFQCLLGIGLDLDASRYLSIGTIQNTEP